MKVFFPAKLLLFGEYLVLVGGQALAMPLPKFGGYWKTNVPTDIALWKYLAFLESEPELSAQIVLKHFEEELIQGLRFESTIPIGYGLGSSACLVAAILKRYGRDSDIPNAEKQDLLALMESPFHGKSSGFDPLVIYMNQAVHINDEALLTTAIHQPLWQSQRPFLLDSGQGRQTSLLVQKFRQQMESEAYRNQIIHEAIPLSNSLIRALMDGNTQNFQTNIYAFSALQLALFADMIPDAVKDVWQSGLHAKTFALKLCGAGGGGFFLGFGDSPAAFETIPLT